MAADRSQDRDVSVNHDLTGDVRTKSDILQQIAYSENPNNIAKFRANASAYLDNKGLLSAIERRDPRDLASWAQLVASTEVHTMSQLDLQLTYLAYVTEFWDKSRKAFNILSQWKGLSECKRPHAIALEMRKANRLFAAELWHELIKSGE